MDKCKGDLECGTAQALASKPSIAKNIAVLILVGTGEGGNALWTSQFPLEAVTGSGAGSDALGTQNSNQAGNQGKICLVCSVCW